MPQRSGVLALTLVFEPYIVLFTLPVVVVAVAGRWRPAVILAAALLIVAVGRYGPTWVSLPAPAQGETMKVVSWNVLAGPDAAARVLDGLATTADADLIGLLELQPAMAEAVMADPALAQRFAHQAFDPDSSVYGVGLLSRYPILEQSSSHDPPYLRALVGTPDVATVVYVVHPLPARIRTIGSLPVALETATRDADMALIRGLIEADLVAGGPVIIVGDINTTEREPAYAAFAAGLRDAHLDAGIGPGLTWRPGWLPSPPFGVLRIDYIFTSTQLRAASSGVTCLSVSDHCLVTAELTAAGGG